MGSLPVPVRLRLRSTLAADPPAIARCPCVLRRQPTTTGSNSPSSTAPLPAPDPLPAAPLRRRPPAPLTDRRQRRRTAATARRGRPRRSQAAPTSRLSRTALRQRLRVNNARLDVALQTLGQRGLAVCGTPAGTCLPDQALSPSTRSFPLLFRCSTVPHHGRAWNGTTITHTPRHLSRN